MRKILAMIENHPSELWGYFENFLIRPVRVFDPRSASLGNQARPARAHFLPQHCTLMAAVTD